jgi:hypothetical protein
MRKKTTHWRAAAFHFDDEIFSIVRLTRKRDRHIAVLFMKLQSLFEDLMRTLDAVAGHVPSFLHYIRQRLPEMLR